MSYRRFQMGSRWIKYKHSCVSNLYTFMYTYMYICIYIIQIHIQTYMHTHLYMYIYTTNNSHFRMGSRRMKYNNSWFSL